MNWLSYLRLIVFNLFYFIISCLRFQYIFFNFLKLIIQKHKSRKDCNYFLANKSHDGINSIICLILYKVLPQSIYDFYNIQLKSCGIPKFRYSKS